MEVVLTLLLIRGGSPQRFIGGTGFFVNNFFVSAIWSQKPERSWGFHPRRFGFPKCDTPEQVICHHRIKHRGDNGEQEFPPRKS
jgi:hypothetical protein